MATTEYLGLALTDASEIKMKFLEWRQLVNGVLCGSNMEILDEAISKLNDDLGGKADGFTLDAETGVLQLTCNGVALEGDSAAVTINLSQYYTKTETDQLLATLQSTLESSMANNETIQQLQTSIEDVQSQVEELSSAAVGDLAWDEETRTLSVLTLDGATVKTELVIEGGGGTGGGSSYTVRLTNGTYVNGTLATTFTKAAGTDTVLTATYTEYYGDDVTGQGGTLTIKYKLSTQTEYTTYKTMTVACGEAFSVDVTELLTAGSITNIQFTVVGGESEVTRTMTYTVTCVEASIATVNFDSTAVYTGNFTLQYRCVGRGLSKIVYFYIDGEYYTEVDVGTSNNTTLSQSIGLTDYSYGTHDITLWFETSDGAKSNVVTISVIYDDGTSTEPIIGATLGAEEIDYGDTVVVNYVVYTPGEDTTAELNIRLYAIEDGVEVPYSSSTLENVTNNISYTWSTAVYPESGTAYIELSSGSTVKTLELTINAVEFDYDLDYTTANLVYAYSATGRSNNDTGKDTFTYVYTQASGTDANIYTSFDNFNWASDGYLGDNALTLSGTATHTIKLPIFSTSFVNDDGETVSLESSSNASTTTNGRTIEFEFMVSSVTDQNAEIIRCMDSAHTGIVVTPQVCYLLTSSGTDVDLDSTGFIENEESIPAAYLKDDERLRLSFVLGAVNSDNRQTVDIYVNGEYRNSVPYDSSTRYSSTEYITFGSDTCILKLYDVKLYNRGLTATEVLQNYMVAPAAVADKLARLEDNDVLNDDGDVDYEKARVKYPCLWIIGEFSPVKGTKRKCGAILTKPDGEGGYNTEFSLLDQDANGEYLCTTNVQGTSSQKFIRKNYKLAMAYYTYDDEGNAVSTKYKYPIEGYDADGNALSVKESTLCYKIDYMSTDHANTFNANMAETLFDNDTIAKQENSLTQNTVHGFRCLLFRSDTIDSTIEFSGDGCLNNDKSNTKTFGLEVDGDSGNVTTRQKWEFLNNTNSLCFFQSDNLVGLDNTGTKNVVAALESAYPDQGDLEDEGLEPNYDYLQALFTWVYRRANFLDASEDSGTGGTYGGVTYDTEREYRKAIFQAEFTKHWNLDHALVYYAFAEAIGLADNRAKNMFIRCEDVYAENLVDPNGNAVAMADCIGTDGVMDIDAIDWENSEFAIWITDLYDLDSCFGAENSGYLRVPYYAEWYYELDGARQFNGSNSNLWVMFEEAFASEIKAKVQELAADGLLTYDNVYQIHITDNAELVCPAVINRDMSYKYDDPWIEGYYDYSTSSDIQTSEYKYLQRGSRTQQKADWIFKRFQMLYSKYQTTQFLKDYITFRAGQDVEPENSAITLCAMQAMYPAIYYGDTSTADPISGGKVAAGEEITLQSTQRIGRSDTVYLCGGSNYTEVSSLANFYPYEVSLTGAKKLKTVLLGSDEDGYVNTSLSSLSVANSPLLETLNIMGCTGLTSVIDLSSNTLIKYIYAGNSVVPSFKLPDGGVLTEFHVGTITGLTVLNQTNLEVFDYDDISGLQTLWVENTPNIDVMGIVANGLPNLVNGLRLAGVDADLGDDITALEMLVTSDAQGKRLDASGNLSNDSTAWPYIEGTVRVNSIGSYLLGQLNELYPELTVEYDMIVQQYTYTWVDWDGTVLETQLVYAGTYATASTLTPERAADKQYIYTFSGWDYDVTSAAANSNMTITAVYSYEDRTYTVSWYNGSTLIYSTSGLLYGSCEDYDEDTYGIPENHDYDANLTFSLFSGWDKSAAFVEDDMNIYAQFDREAVPASGSLSAFSIPQLNSLIQGGVLASDGGYNAASGSAYYQMILSGDEFPLVMGHDYDFSNVDSLEIVALGNDMTFDGASEYYIPTDAEGNTVQLFKEDSSWTLAIDFTFTGEDADGLALAACRHSTGAGFALMSYNSAPYIFYNSTDVTDSATRSSSAIGTSTSTSSISVIEREIVVLRHQAGDPTLYIYGSYKRANAPVAMTMTQTVFSTHTAPLTFGAECDSTGYRQSYAQGTIHWCKLWYGDLGDATCVKLSQWPRETNTIRASAIGTNPTLFQAYTYVNESTGVDTGNYVNCFFQMEGVLDVAVAMNSTSTNAGGWASSSMRTYLQRIPDAMPDQLRYLLKTVTVTGSTGEQTTDSFAITQDQVFLISVKEAGLNATTAPYASESNGAISYYSTNASRIKYFGDTAAYWWTRSPGSNVTGFLRISSTGSNASSGTASMPYAVSYAFCI